MDYVQHRGAHASENKNEGYRRASHQVGLAGVRDLFNLRYFLDYRFRL